MLDFKIPVCLRGDGKRQLTDLLRPANDLLSINFTKLTPNNYISCTQDSHNPNTSTKTVNLGDFWSDLISNAPECIHHQIPGFVRTRGFIPPTILAKYMAARSLKMQLSYCSLIFHSPSKQFLCILQFQPRRLGE